MRYAFTVVCGATFLATAVFAQAAPPKWEGKFPNNFKLTLTEGNAKAATTPEGMTLEGTVVISAECGGSFPNTCVAPAPPPPAGPGSIPMPLPGIAPKLTLRGAVVTALKKPKLEVNGGGGGSSASTQLKVQPNLGTRVSAQGSPAAAPAVQASGYALVSGKGEVELSLVSSTGPITTLKLKSSEVTVRADADGTLHVDAEETAACTTKSSTTITLPEIKNSSTTKCKFYTLERTQTLKAASAAGTEKVLAFGQTLEGTFNGGPNDWVHVTATWSNAGTGWKTVPGTQDRAEYRIVKPKIAAETDGILLQRMTLSADRIEVRSKENKPDGTPWMSAQSSNASVTLGGDGRGALSLAALPAPADVLKNPRDACIASASKLAPKDNPLSKNHNEHDDFMNAQTAICEKASPRPPQPIPTPPTITVDASIKIE